MDERDFAIFEFKTIFGHTLLHNLIVPYVCSMSNELGNKDDNLLGIDRGPILSVII